MVASVGSIVFSGKRRDGAATHYLGLCVFFRYKYLVQAWKTKSMHVCL